MEMMSPRRTRRFLRTTLLTRIFDSSQVLSIRTMQTVSRRFLPCKQPSLENWSRGESALRRTVSPRNNWRCSIVFAFKATTELSSLMASSTTRRFGAFFRSKIAVLKSFFLGDLKTRLNPPTKGTYFGAEDDSGWSDIVQRETQNVNNSNKSNSRDSNTPR